MRTILTHGQTPQGPSTVDMAKLKLQPSSKQLQARWEAQKQRKAKQKEAKKCKRLEDSSVFFEPPKPIMVLEPQLLHGITMQGLEDSVPFIDMTIPKAEPCHSKPSKRKVFARLEDIHTLCKETSLISLVVEAITSQRDQSIVKEMSKLNILLNGMQKGMMVSANKGKTSPRFLLTPNPNLHFNHAGRSKYVSQEPTQVNLPPHFWLPNFLIYS